MRGGGLLCAFVAVLLIGGAARLAQIGGENGADLRQRAEKQQTATWMITAQRGEILDARGRVLAGTVREPSAFVDPALVDDERFTAYSVGPTLGLDPAELEGNLRTWREQSRFVWLKRHITEQERVAFEGVVTGRGLAGLGIRYETTRKYPQQDDEPIAPHVLGFVGLDRCQLGDTNEYYEDLRGLAGLEAQYNSILAGQPGKRMVKVDRRRRPVETPVEVLEPATDGATLVLTIDTFIQVQTQKILRETWTRYGADWAAAVVLDPHSGEVLALASMPDFDPDNAIPDNIDALSDRQKKALADRWRDRAVSDAYEPGSIFKPFTAAAALDEGLTRLDEVFVINGPAHSFGSRTIHDTHAYRQLTLHEVISKSSNIGMGLLGARCGCTRLHDYVTRFGFGSVTGVGLPGEHDGLVLPLDRWNPRFSPQSVPIGQEIGATPIQLATAFCVFANGGVLMKPRIIRGVIAPDGQVLEDNSLPIEVRRVISERTAEEFRRRALVETVQTGTGKEAAIPGYQVFGKTGTAQIAEPGRGYVKGWYVSSFMGGAPATDPRLVVLVSIYKPTKNAYYGGQVAAPAVARILAETLAYLHVPKELPDDTPLPKETSRRH